MTDEITRDAAATEGGAAATGYVVQVYVCGHYSGDYHHPTEAEAQADADDRGKRFGVLGCHYRVRPHTDQAHLRQPDHDSRKETK